VAVQYKDKLSDKSTFFKDEWGPWYDTTAAWTNESGKTSTEDVLRSVPGGMDIMTAYPDIEKQPAIEQFLQPEKWRRGEVLKSISKYVYNNKEAAEANHATWNALGQWHTSTPSDAMGRMPIKITTSSGATTSPLTHTHTSKATLSHVQALTFS
jgi:hypothetical protein